MTIAATAPGVPAYVLISGPEGVLAERALASTLEQLRAAQPDIEVIRLAAQTYSAGEVAIHASPSLFGGAKVIVVQDLDEAAEELQTDLLDLLAAPAEDVWLVVTHKSGARGKKVLDTLRKSGARVSLRAKDNGRGMNGTPISCRAMWTAMELEPGAK